MTALREWLVRAWGSLRRRRRDEDLEAELRAHLDLAGERAEASRVAQAMDALRDQRGLPWLDHVLLDARYGLRGLRRTPLFTAVAVLSLGLGIGANTTLFSLVDDLLLRSLPVRNPERLVHVRQAIVMAPSTKKASPAFSAAMLDEARTIGAFGEIVGFIPQDRPLVTIDGVPEPPRQVEEVSWNFFTDLGVAPVIGRAPHVSDGAAAILGYGLWRSRFGTSPDVLGRSIAVNARPYVITGVAPPRFNGVAIDTPADLWIASPGAPPMQMVARLAPGVTLAQAGSATEALFRTHAADIGAPPEAIRAELVPAGRGISGLRTAYEKPLEALTILVMLVLLLTCTNVGSLLMVRNAGRQREVTVRVALGATRSRLLRQYIVESALLAVMSGVLALAFARWGVAIVLSMLPLASPPKTLAFDTDARVLAFVAVISSISALLFGVAPAWRAARVDPVNELRASQGSTPTRRTRRLGRVFVASQVALSVLLLVGAGLFLNTLRNLRSVDVGFDADVVLQVLTDTRGAGYGRGEQATAVYRLLLERVGAVPGVASVTAARNPVMRGAGSRMAVRLPGMLEEPDEMWAGVTVGPSFFETMGIAVVRGRTFAPADFDYEGPRYVVNEAFLRRYFPTSDPVGDGNGPIIGVVKNTRIVGVRDDIVPIMFERISKRLDRLNALEVRTSGDPQAVATAVGRVVRDIHPRLLVQISTLRQEIDRDIATERMVATMSAAFGALGVLLAAIGIFGVASYTVAQRTSEFGIRMALGAGRRRIVVEALRGTMLVFAAGLSAGLLAAVAASRLAASVISDLLFGLAPTDLSTLMSAGVAMIAVAAIACLVPARHATRIDPLTAIRHE